MKKLPEHRLISLRLLSLTILMLISACSALEHAPGPITPMQRSNDYRHVPIRQDFKAIDIMPKVRQKKLQQKVQRLLVLIDQSTPFARIYKGQSRALFLKQTFQNFQNSIPQNIKFDQQLIIFGLGKGENVPALADLSSALKHSQQLLTKHSDKSAILILSEWQQINLATQNQVQKLYAEHPQLCIHMIGIGNIHKNLSLKQIHQCGKNLSADQLTSPNKMANWVQSLFFTEPIDSDADGIYDFKDRCPNTLHGQPIDWHGCPRDSHNSNPLYLIPRKY